MKSSLQRRLLLVAGSFFFYSWGNPIHLIFLILSGLIDYLIGNELHRKKNVFFLFLSIGLNLGILSLFKFSDFASETFHFSIFNKSYLLSGIPIGVSFYTFQSMSYSIDIYRRKLEPAKDVFHFFSFLAFFPQLVAGPICRGSELLGQLEILDSKEIKFEEAAKLLVIGFFQKMFLADQLF
ncbi:MAG: MBOAT family protein, partial [Deltaproteobacteria bacterium]